MTSEPTPTETARLVLRPVVADDGPVLAGLYSDPHVARFIGGDSLDQAAAQGQAERFASVWSARGYGQSVLQDQHSARRAFGVPTGSS